MKKKRVLNILLWAAQVLLALIMLWAGWMKLFKPAGELAAMWPWTGQIGAGLVRLTGVIDIAGGLGLVLPGLFGVRRQLTPIAAVAIGVLMICASVFHILRGEASLIGVNIVFGLLAAFIAWGRFRLLRA